MERLQRMSAHLLCSSSSSSSSRGGGDSAHGHHNQGDTQSSPRSDRPMRVSPYHNRASAWPRAARAATCAIRSSPAAGHKQPRRIYIVCDSEGGSGMCEYWARNLVDENPRKQEYRELLTRDCNAAIDGCFRGGASEVIVSDDGMGGVMTVPEMMDERALWLRGPGFGGPTSLMQGLDHTFAGVVLIGFHAMQDAQNGVLAHTYSSAVPRRQTINSEPFGELCEYALAAGHDHGVPVLLVSGDRAVCDEATRLLGPGVRTLAVKEGVGNATVGVDKGGLPQHLFGARAMLIAPKRARKMLTEAVREAVSAAFANSNSSVALPKPYRIDGPVDLRLELETDEEGAAKYYASRCSAWEAIGERWPLRPTGSTQTFTSSRDENDGREGRFSFEGTLAAVPRGLKLL